MNSMHRFFLLLFFCALLSLNCCNRLDNGKGGSGGNPEAVDLGLSVKWGSCNVDASRPWELGGFYAWGEIETKEEYDWSTYKWCIAKNGYWTKNTKYFSTEEDGVSVLDPSDDVANVKLGGGWRMPTAAEFDELTNGCNIEWVKERGVYGYRYTSKANGNSVFLPATATIVDYVQNKTSYWGGYWSSTPSEYSISSTKAYIYSFGDRSKGRTSLDDRFYGQPIRPVRSY